MITGYESAQQVLVDVLCRGGLKACVSKADQPSESLSMSMVNQLIIVFYSHFIHRAFRYYF